MICTLFDMKTCRYLKHLGYEVTYVRNFTDVDDKVRMNAMSFSSVFYCRIIRFYLVATRAATPGFLDLFTIQLRFSLRRVFELSFFF